MFRFGDEEKGIHDGVFMARVWECSAASDICMLVDLNRRGLGVSDLERSVGTSKTSKRMTTANVAC